MRSSLNFAKTVNVYLCSLGKIQVAYMKFRHYSQLYVVKKVLSSKIFSYCFNCYWKIDVEPCYLYFCTFSSSNMPLHCQRKKSLTELHLKLWLAMTPHWNLKLKNLLVRHIFGNPLCILMNFKTRYGADISEIFWFLKWFRWF